MSSFEHEGFHCSATMPICDCSPCPRGTYGDGRQFCLSCPPGKWIKYYVDFYLERLSQAVGESQSRLAVFDSTQSI